MSNVATAQQSVNVTTPAKANKPDFGKGRYSPAMEELYADLQRLFPAIPQEKCEKIAHQFGSDFGAAMRNAPVTVKFGKKLSDDGKLTLSEAARLKGVTATNSILIARAVDFINTAKGFNISVRDTEWALTPELDKWIDEM